MIKVAITGGNGFLGTHMRFFLYEKKDEYEVVLIDKNDFEDEGSMVSKIDGSSAVLHFAGLNRGDEEEIYKTNTELTNKILNACDKLDKKPRVLFVSSTHNTRDTAYGRSKRDSERMITEWGKKHNVATSSVVSTNIFGEFGKPDYNSFVSTFCRDIVSDKTSQMNEEVKVNLVYVRDVCSFFFDLIRKEKPEEQYSISGVEVTIGEVYKKLKMFKEEYFSGVIPKLENKFELNLFNTLRSYLYPHHFPRALDLKTDNRGFLFEMVKEKNGGQTFFSSTHLGILRGGHYHTRKIERFCVISGEASIKIRKIFTSEVIEYKVSGNKPVYVDMPVYYAHSIENIGKGEMLAVFWVNEIYDPKDSDTFMEPVVI